MADAAAPLTTLSWPLFYAMFAGHLVVYFGGPVWAFSRGWPAVAGGLMLLAALMPIAGQVWFTNSESPVLGILLLVEGPIALIVTGLGLAVHLSRWLTRA